MLRSFSLLALLTAVILVPSTGRTADAAGADLIGKPAPQLTGEFALNGKPVKISDLKGKVVLIDFWAVWCPPCVASFPHLTKLHEEFNSQGLEIVGVTKYQEKYGFDKEKGKLTTLTRDNYLKKEQEHDMLKEFSEHHKLKHRIMTISGDDWAKLGKEYKSNGIPTYVLIDRKGNVSMVKVGNSPKNNEEIAAEIKKLLGEK